MAHTHIKICRSCNNNCVFCSQAQKPQFEPATEEVLSAILDAKARGTEYIIISGGEPTLRKDLIPILSFARQQGLCASLQTNARALSDIGYARKVAASGVDPVVASLHAHTPKLYKSLCGADGFEEACTGIRNMASLGTRVSVNVVVTKLNYKKLPEIADLICSELKGVGAVFLSGVQPAGSALAHFKDAVPLFSEAHPFIVGAIEACNNEKRDAIVTDVPLCFLGPYAGNAEEVRMPSHTVEVVECREAGAGLRAYGFDKDSLMCKGPECGLCQLKKNCGGVYREYEKRYGTGELAPVLV